MKLMSRTRFQKAAAVILAVVLLGTLGAGAVFGEEPEGVVSTPKDSFHTRTQDPEKEPETKESNFPREKPDENEYAPAQLSADDIDAMNNGRCAMLFSDENYLTFLQGKYYEGKVTNFEEGIESIQGIQQLLGITKGSEFYAVFGQINANGYTYYTYQQRYGDLTLENAVLKIIIDPEGYTAGLVSSIVPNVGIAPKDESAITPEEAEAIVRAGFPGGNDLRFYSEETRQTSVVSPDGVAMHCWAVFTNLPAEFAETEGPGYLEHLVSYEGEYLYYLSVSSPQEMVYGENVQIEVAMTVFEGLEPAEYTGTVTKHDGTQMEVTVPVAYDPEKGVYILADLKRHIYLTDYMQYASTFSYDPVVSEDNTGWPDVWLLAYDSYIKVYDFYESTGLISTDGFGRPILIMVNWVEDQAPHRPVHNAAFMGYINGWALFGASESGYYGECIDVIGHEFTHGVTDYTMAGWNYLNEPGAVNEAISDILGNLIEMMLGETEDTEWLIAEHSDRTLRNMSYPWQYDQPVTVGGEFSMESVDVGTEANDFGGVHTNSSLVNMIAWKLHAAGMDPLEEFLLFREVQNLLTPLSGFREVHCALVFAAVMREMDPIWVGKIHMYCEEAGY